MNYNDIIKSATQKLKQAYPDLPVYASETIEGYKAPCFFINIYPVKTTYETLNIAEVTLILVISFFSDTEDSVQNNNMLYDLRNLFKLKLKVNDRHLTISDADCEVIGDTYLNNYNSHIALELTYKEFIGEEDEHDLMGTVETQLIVNNDERKVVI